MRSNTILLAIGLMIACANAISIGYKNQNAKQQAQHHSKKDNLLSHRRNDYRNNYDNSFSDDFVAAGPVDGANLNVPIKAKLSKQQDKKGHSHSDSSSHNHHNKKWNSVQVNAELIAEAQNEGKRSGNLIDNEGVPVIKNVIPVELTGETPQNIVEPLNIDQRAAAAYKKKQSHKYNQYSARDRYRNKNHSNSDTRRNHSASDKAKVIKTQIRIGQAN